MLFRCKGFAFIGSFQRYAVRLCSLGQPDSAIERVVLSRPKKVGATWCIFATPPYGSCEKHRQCCLATAGIFFFARVNQNNREASQIDGRDGVFLKGPPEARVVPTRCKRHIKMVIAKGSFLTARTATRVLHELL